MQAPDLQLLPTPSMPREIGCQWILERYIVTLECLVGNPLHFDHDTCSQVFKDMTLLGSISHCIPACAGAPGTPPPLYKLRKSPTLIRSLRLL